MRRKVMIERRIDRRRRSIVEIMGRKRGEVVRIKIGRLEKMRVLRKRRKRNKGKGRGGKKKIINFYI